MRLRPAPLLFVSLLALPAARSSLAAQPQQQAPGATQPAPATATYRNDDLHLTYAYPSGYMDASALVGTALQASLSDDPATSAAAAAHCITLPFSRMQAGPGPGEIAIVALARADSACLKQKFTAKSLAESTAQEARSLSAAGAKSTFGPHVPYTVAGHPADLLQGTFTLPAGHPMHALITCVLDQPDIVCWQFLSTSADRLRTLVTNPVSFDNQAPAALVPTQLLPETK